MLNASEIELSSLAIFNPLCFIFLAAAWEGWEGEKGMEEKKLVKTDKYPGPGRRDFMTSIQLRQTPASGTS